MPEFSKNLARVRLSGGVYIYCSDRELSRILEVVNACTNSYHGQASVLGKNNIDTDKAVSLIGDYNAGV